MSDLGRERMDCERVEGAVGTTRDKREDHRAMLNFAEIVVAKLAKNAHKPHWKHATEEYLFFRLAEEVGELSKAITAGASADEVVSECADVAAFAMMIADNRRASR